MAAGSGTSLAAPPTNEIGSEQPLGGAPTGLFGGATSWRTFIDTYERTPELMWPRSVQTYSEMRNDSQVEALHYGATLPIRRYNWMIDPNGARPEIVQGLSTDMGLPVKGEPDSHVRRRKGRFSWDYTLRHILLSILYGHMYFEQVGYIDDGPNGDGLWHLKKLAPRMPDTIQEIQVADDGGLVAIKQLVGTISPAIPVDRLVAYVWDKEGANWAGRSMLRSCFKDWIIKDRLVRVDANKQERNGMGIPVAEAPPNASDAQIRDLNRMARSIRAGSSAGGAIPHDSKLTLQGTQGTLPDTLASIRRADEAMARRFLMMFMQLGQTETGSRALGGAFIDWFALAQETLAEFVCTVTIEHVFEDWVDWNYGEDEELVPQLVFERNEDNQYPTSDLVDLINAGAIVVDEDMENDLRARFDLSAKPAEQEPPPGPPEPTPPEPAPAAEPPKASARPNRRSTRRVLASSAPSVSLPDRELRRQPYEQEVQAQVDFGKLDQQWATAVDKLAKAMGPVRDAQLAQLGDAIVAADGDLSALAGIAADPVGADVIETQLVSTAKEGAAGLVSEATAQGAEIATPDLAPANEALASRAEAVDKLLARSLSEVAARKAMEFTGGALTPEEVRDAVMSYIGGLSDTYVRDQLGGAISAAQNAGRKAAIGQGPKPQNIYSSELLDENTCDPCTTVDGTEYDDMDAAEADYPTGGYMDCDGGPRCRGTLIAVYDEAAPSGSEE